MLTQIYETSTQEEARAISKTDADRIGFPVGNASFVASCLLYALRKSPVPLSRHQRCRRYFRPPMSLCIEKWARDLHSAIVHLGAAPELLFAADVAGLKSRLPDALIPGRGRGNHLIACNYQGITNFLLLDSIGH